MELFMKVRLPLVNHVALSKARTVIGIHYSRNTRADAQEERTEALLNFKIFLHTSHPSLWTPLQSFVSRVRIKSAGDFMRMKNEHNKMPVHPKPSKLLSAPHLSNQDIENKDPGNTEMVSPTIGGRRNLWLGKLRRKSHAPGLYLSTCRSPRAQEWPLKINSP
ncbi:hypothetical protein D5F01_LYC08520 [Larimichthys crocea]|uniref:Uncharacterized protein n=1 Tax=Larimichthys crocea TaxID=215358 RepID=A0A6G0IPF7_LARCR|nr:hypothetical protein D5F01_LYC08520 [Larimichthys crocea]